MNKVDIAFMTDYGQSYGKGLEIKNIASESLEKKVLGRVYLRNKSKIKDKTYSYQENVFLFGSFFFRILTAVQKYLFASFRARYWQELLFDFLVSIKINETKSSNFFYGVPRLKMSFKKAKELGHTTILHAAEMNATENIKILNNLYGNNKKPSIWDSALLERSCQTYKYVDYVIAHSEEAMKSYIRNGFDESNVFITPMGFDRNIISKKELYSSKGKTKFLYVGNVTKMKGVHLILDAWDKIDSSQAELHICGSIYEDMEILIDKYISEYPNIYFHGYVNPSDWFKKCDVFIFPSLSEGFSRVVVEAAASGIAVVVSEVSTDKGLFDEGENGFVIKASSSEISSKIDFLIGEFAMIKKIGMRSAQDFSSLTWASFGKKTADILIEIIERNKNKY